MQSLQQKQNNHVQNQTIANSPQLISQFQWHQRFKVRLQISLNQIQMHYGFEITQEVENFNQKMCNTLPLREIFFKAYTCGPTGPNE